MRNNVTFLRIIPTAQFFPDVYTMDNVDKSFGGPMKYVKRHADSIYRSSLRAFGLFIFLFKSRLRRQNFA